MAKNVLGKGLEALIPWELDEEGLSTHQAIVKVPLSRIRANPHQPRRKIDPKSIEELAQSIQSSGILQPILVRPLGNGEYELIAGERRLHAARHVQWEEIPAIVHDDIPETKALEIALVENIQREDLNPIDEALAYQNLIDQLSLSQEQLSLLVGKKRSTIANSLRLLRLSPEVREAVSAGQISSGHARAILSLPEDRQRKDLFQKIVLNSLSVREAEKEAKRLLSSPPSGTSRPKEEKDERLAALEEHLNRRYQTRVGIKSFDNNRGKIVINFNSKDELKRILLLLGGK